MNRLLLATAIALLGTGGGWADNTWSVATPGFSGTEYKLQATLGSPGTDAYVESTRPAHATYYEATFVLDPTGIAMPPGGTAVRFLHLVDDGEGGIDPVAGVLTVGFLRNRADTGQWHASFWNKQDSGAYALGVDLPLGTSLPVEVKIEFWRGSVGQTTFCVQRAADPASRVCNAALDLEEGDVDSLRIGLFTNSNPANYGGSFTFDELRSSWQ